MAQLLYQTLTIRVLLEDAVIDMSKGAFTGKKATTGKYPWVVHANEVKLMKPEILLTSAEIKHENHQSESPYCHQESEIRHKH